MVPSTPSGPPIGGDGFPPSPPPASPKSPADRKPLPKKEAPPLPPPPYKEKKRSSCTGPAMAIQNSDPALFALVLPVRPHRQNWNGVIPPIPQPVAAARPANAPVRAGSGCRNRPSIACDGKHQIGPLPQAPGSTAAGSPRQGPPDDFRAAIQQPTWHRTLISKPKRSKSLTECPEHGGLASVCLSIGKDRAHRMEGGAGD